MDLGIKLYGYWYRVRFSYYSTPSWLDFFSYNKAEDIVNKAEAIVDLNGQKFLKSDIEHTDFNQEMHIIIQRKRPVSLNYLMKDVIGYDPFENL